MLCVVLYLMLTMIWGLCSLHIFMSIMLWFSLLKIQVLHCLSDVCQHIDEGLMLYELFLSALCPLNLNKYYNLMLVVSS